jgi:peptide deformylase
VTVRPLVVLGDPVLRTPAQPVADLDDVQELIDDLIETKRAAHGAGLAANQVGELRRVAVVEVEPGNPRYPYKPPYPLTVLVNPRIVSVSPTTIDIDEGCLSVPGKRGTVPRHAEITVEFEDRHGVTEQRTVAGLTAGTFQHEIDHLDGILFLDRATAVMAWEDADFEARARAIVERWGS